MDNLLKSKAALILDQPFFATIMLGMDIKEGKVKTLETNGEEITFNKEFMEKQNLNETIFLMAHEVLHSALLHPHRRGNRDPEKWNKACDYVVNDLLIKDKIGQAPKGALIDPTLVANGDGSAEGVYNLLPDEPGDGSGGHGEPGGALDNLTSPGKDQSECSQKEAEMQVKVAQAANAAKMAGKLSQGMERLVKEVVKSRTDWRAVLRRFISEKAKNEYTYSKMKRRFIPDDIYLPGLSGEKVGAVVIAFDCSGSIDDDTVKLFSSEIKGIIEDVTPSQVDVIYFDSEVAGHDTFGPDDEFQVNPRGGGGTAFSPVFDHIAKLDLDVKACIFLTDLYCSDFGKDPGYPVLWTTIGSTEAPFGEVIKLQE